MTEQEQQLVQMLRDDAGPIRPNRFLDAADVVERIIGERDQAADEIERLRKALSDIALHQDEPFSADYARDALGPERR
jgi:hypothetical protein